MAKFIDLPFEQLVAGAPKLIRDGFTGTQTYVLSLPGETDKALIVELSGTDRPIGTWTIKRGRAYRITPGKVASLPLIENDPNPVRRLCRLNGLPLTCIKYVARGEQVYMGPAHHHGSSSYCSIELGEQPVALKGVQTTGNPAYVWKIFVVRGEEPTYEILRQIVEEQGWMNPNTGEAFQL